MRHTPRRILAVRLLGSAPVPGAWANVNVLFNKQVVARKNHQASSEHRITSVTRGRILVAFLCSGCLYVFVVGQKYLRLTASIASSRENASKRRGEPGKSDDLSCVQASVYDEGAVADTVFWSFRPVLSAALGVQSYLPPAGPPSFHSNESPL